MAHVVFLRGVNVGGRKVFRPAALVRELAHLEAINIGAVGTFVTRAPVTKAALRRDFLRVLPFEAEMMICDAREIVDLNEGDYFRSIKIPVNAKTYLTILAKAPRPTPKLPIRKPDGNQWGVQVTAIRGRYALSLRRPIGRNVVYPNEVIEKSFGITATTRSWSTVATICKILSS